MSITFDTEIVRNFDEAVKREWLETNGLGGWAGATVAGALTRRYHGLLVTSEPNGPEVRLAKLDESVVAGDQRYDLGCNQFPDTVHPEGHQYMTSFARDLFPVFEYLAGTVRLRKTVVAVYGKSATLVIYDVLEAGDPFDLEFRPFVPDRQDGALTGHEGDEPLAGAADYKGGIFHFARSDDAGDLFIVTPGAEFQPEPTWHRQFEYTEEKYRGLDSREDLFSHGVFRRTMRAGDTAGIIVSAEDPTGWDAVAMREFEQLRREGLTAHLSDDRETLRTLTLAADQFIINRDRPAIFAGYHWHGERLRDTLIALPGLCLTTGRHDEARDLLHLCAEQVHQGMLPDRIPNEGDTAEYNGIDTALWFFIATYRYLTATGDEAFVRDNLLPVLRDIVSWHEIGTRHGLRMDDDGLLTATASEAPMTWMDAVIDGKEVTPRHGKVVEVNALWYNALVIVAELSLRFGDTYDAREYRLRADRVKTSFYRVFWNESAGCLYDTVNGRKKDAAIRPNQIFALSLPIPLLIASQARQVLDAVEKNLLTPRGLRSLSPDHKAYEPHYDGAPQARHAAYHQGTVWGWLIGPYLTALLRIRPRTGRDRMPYLLRDLFANLEDAGIGGLSEIYDGDPPHLPRGCIAYAASVGEVLRVMDELDLS